MHDSICDIVDLLLIICSNELLEEEGKLTDEHEGL